MKKSMVFILIAICTGLFLTWSAITATASQEFFTRPLTKLKHSIARDMGIYKNPPVNRAKDENLHTEVLLVYVETADGMPAITAQVEAYSMDGTYQGSRFTGPDGYAALDLLPGVYQIIAYSKSYHFFLSQANVNSPGTINLSAQGTPEITLTAVKKDGSPMDYGEVYLGVPGQNWTNTSLGYVDSNGEMVFHLSPAIYDLGVMDEVNQYAVYTTGLEFSDQNYEVSFDMSIQPSAEIVAGHPNDTYSTLAICTSEFLFCYVDFDCPDGTHLVVSAGLGYHLDQDLQREDGSGTTWNYEFGLTNSYEPISFSPGEVVHFTVGGELEATGRTEDTIIGEFIPIAAVTDSNGSYLTFIYTETADHQDVGIVSPVIMLTDPWGFSSRVNFWYNLSYHFPTGIYSVDFEWETGEPYQGLMTAESQFNVLPQQTSSIIPIEGGELYSTWDDTRYEFTAGTFTDTVIVTHTVKYIFIPGYGPWLSIGHFFDVTAVYSDTGLPAQPTQPYTITIGYTDSQRGIVIEDSLKLFHWDMLNWVPEETGTIDLANNKLNATPNHFSTWGVLGDTNRVFLALINR